MNLREVLQAYLDHRHEVLERRSKYRLSKIEHRLEVLDGYLIAYLNLDELIEIIRREDEPKPVMMQRFNLTDVQAAGKHNMPLPLLRRLEAMETKTEPTALSKESDDRKQS